jgi:hypothetical protein
MKEKPARIAYFGPTLPGAMLRHGTVFIGDIPQEIQDRIKQIPGIFNLFISKDFWVSAKQELKESGSLMHTSAGQVRQWARGYVKKRYGQSAALAQKVERS